MPKSRRRSGQLVATVMALAVAAGGCDPLPTEDIAAASTSNDPEPVVLGLYVDLESEYNESHGYPIGQAVSYHDYRDQISCQVEAQENRTPGAVMVRVEATGEVLWRAPVTDFGLCEGDRFVWDGQELIRLDEDEPWPAGVIVPDEDEVQRYPDYSP